MFQRSRRRTRRHGRRRVALIDLDRQLIPLVDQVLLARGVVDALDRRADRREFLLGLRPVTVVDQGLDLSHLLLRSQRHAVVTHGLRFPQQCCAQSVQRIARTGATDHRTEPADAQHGGGERRHDRQTAVPATLGRLRVHAVAQRGRGLAFGDQVGGRGPTDLIAPIRQQGEQLGFVGIRGLDAALGGDRIQELVSTGDGVQGLPAR